MGPRRTTPWRVWDLDMELRYRPAVRALPPPSGLGLCEVGCGDAGLAPWVEEEVHGVDVAPVLAPLPPNLVRTHASGDALPYADERFRATAAIDTFEHIPPAIRAAVVSEMLRVTAPGGHVVINGPTGAAAARGDLRLLADLERAGADGGSMRWVREHIEKGLPTPADLRRWFDDPRVERLQLLPLFPVPAWQVMHRAALGRFPRTGPLHPVVWAPLAAVARRVHRGPCYRTLVVATRA